jgi:hypothetical protein
MIHAHMKSMLLAGAALLGFLAGCQQPGDGMGLDSAGKVVPFCQSHPTDPSCVAVDPCIANPSLPGCKVDTCKANPDAPGCKVDTCAVYPSHPSCNPVTGKKFADILPILKENCQQCHMPGGAGYAQGKMLLSDDSAYASLVGVPAANQTVAKGWVRVKPRVPDSSILYLKVSMASPKLPDGKVYGQAMPVGKPPLTAATLDLIKQWILDGAEK